jgi:predicted dinucleotide-binding enzyme
VCTWWLFPFAQLPDLEAVIATVPAEMPVIDTGNSYPFRHEKIGEVAAGKSESVWASEQLGRPVIKALNAILAPTLKASAKHKAGGSDRDPRRG